MSSEDDKNKDNDNAELAFLPRKAFFTLHEACECKGLNYKTACNKKILQPNKGKPEGKLGGRKVWSYGTIASWITQLDQEIMNLGEEQPQIH